MNLFSVRVKRANISSFSSWGHFIHFFPHKSWKKNTNFFSCGTLHLHVVHEVFIEVPLFHGICSAMCTYNSQPNFRPNIWVFAKSPIYRKLIHDNISLLYWKPRIYCLVFWRRYKIVHTPWKLCLVFFCRRYILFLFINIGIIIFVSVILKKTKTLYS